MNVIAKLKVKNGKVVPVSNGVDYSIKDKTFIIRVLNHVAKAKTYRFFNAEVKAKNQEQAIEKVRNEGYLYAN